MIRPNAELRKLIATATPEQNARAVAKARDWWNMCRKLEIAPAEASRVLKEALEMELAGNVGDVGDVAKSRDDYFTRRHYSQNYREP
jgi:hypothetical protein